MYVDKNREDGQILRQQKKPKPRTQKMSFFGLTCLLLAFLLLLPCQSIAAQTNLTLGETLIAGDNKAPNNWLSPSGDFAFGFNKQEDTKDFLVSIWYAKIPESTVVWYPRAFTSPVPKGSKLAVTPDRGLLLTDPGGAFLWSPETIVTAVSGGFLDDSGNLGLKNEDYQTTWESFSNPSDTLLPGQEIVRSGSVLFSRQSSENATQGRFRLNLQDGVLQLTSINLPSAHQNEPYYVSAADASNVTGVGFNGSSGYLYLLRQNGEKSVLSEGKPEKMVSSVNYYLRATLEYDGVFVQYSYPKNQTENQQWTSVWLAPDDICVNSVASKSSGVCGYNRICRLVAHRPICECPRGFTLVDPNDMYRGCTIDLGQNCQGDRTPPEDEFVINELANVDWPFSDYEQLEPYQKEECKDSCLHDCMCAVAIFRDNICWKKKLPLSNGRVGDHTDAIAFIKGRKYDNGGIPNLNNHPGPDAGNKDTLIIAGSVLLGSSVFVNFILISASLIGFFLIYRKKIVKIFKDDNFNINIRCFTYKELEDATTGFKEQLGRGSFGTVYRGVIETGGSVQTVAIKKLDRLFQENEREFKTEVLVIGQTHHKNLVRLFGYCNEGQNRLLVYEFLSNGSLASFIFEEDPKPSWDQRTQILFDIGRGLLYLHEECSTQVIHCDIKPQNILLDDDYSARISDFGLAKLLLMRQSHTLTGIRGTRGYVAPEWFRNMPITTKVDVYSFGVVLLEVISCRKSIDVESGGEERVILAEWVYDCYVEKKLESLVEFDEEAVADMKKLERFVMVAIWCIQEDPALRPTMKKVMLMLEGIIQVPVPLCPFPYSTMITV